MIVLKEIEKIYLTKNSPQVVALKNINLTFESKGMVFITGKSGCGKSTLLNILGALDSCTSGSMIIENKNINIYYLRVRHNDFRKIFFTHNIHLIKNTPPNLCERWNIAKILKIRRVFL